MRKVRIAKFPDRVIEVDDAEYQDLSRQGLLVKEPAPVPEVRNRRESVPADEKED